MDNRLGQTSPLESIHQAVHDAWLQLRAKPLLLFAVWGLLVAVPQLVLNSLFHGAINAAVDAAIKMVSDSQNITSLPGESTDVITKGLQIMLLVFVLLSIASIYMGSVLSKIVNAFRSGQAPELRGVFQEGAEGFLPFFLSVISSALRIIAILVASYVAGVLLGLLFRDPLLIPFSAMTVGFIAGFLNFGLGPFIHLSAGLPGAKASRLSRLFYRTHKVEVSALFLSMAVLPMMIVSFLGNILIRMGMSLTAGNLVAGIIQSLVFSFAVLVYINFSMNRIPGIEPSEEVDPPGELLEESGPSESSDFSTDEPE